MEAVIRLYTRYALGLLVLTLAAGVYLRAVFAWPALRGGLNGPHLVHAHSHVAFFGWAVLAAFGGVLALSRRRGATTPGRGTLRLLEGLAHGIAAGSVLAFVGFALRGYDTVTIALSALHVGLWTAFVAAAWRLTGTRAGAGALLHRAALAFLVVAGLSTVAPVLVMVRGVADPWLQQLAVKLFLALFVNGFLLLSAAAILYGEVAGPRHARAVLLLLAAGTLPSALLHVPAPPPASWLIDVGRAGVALSGAGVLLLARDVLRRRASALLRMVAVLAALAGALQLLAATGVGAALLHSRFVTIAYLHLLLLGVITPALLHGVRAQHARSDVRVTVFGAGVLVMCGALVGIGWPAASRVLSGAGILTDALLRLALAGGVVAAGALLALYRQRAATTSHEKERKLTASRGRNARAPDAAHA